MGTRLAHSCLEEGSAAKHRSAPVSRELDDSMVLIDKLSIIVNRGSLLLSEAVVLKIESIIANFVKQIYKNKRSPEQTVTA